MKKKFIIYFIERLHQTRNKPQLHLVELFPDVDSWETKEDAEERLKLFMENDSQYESWMRFTILPIYSL